MLKTGNFKQRTCTTLIIAALRVRHQKHEILLQLTECQYYAAFKVTLCIRDRIRVRQDNLDAKKAS
jgi:hypothetical protein